MAMLVHPPHLMSYSRRARSFFSRMTQLSGSPPFSSRFEGGVLVAMVGWLHNNLHRIRARMRCFWYRICKYFWWLRGRLIRFWNNIPEPPSRRPSHIDLTEEQIRRVLGYQGPAREKDPQQPPPQEPQEALRKHKRWAPLAGLGRFPGPVRVRDRGYVIRPYGHQSTWPPDRTTTSHHRRN